MNQKTIKISLILLLSMLACFLGSSLLYVGHKKSFLKHTTKIIYNYEHSPFVNISIFFEGGKAQEKIPGIGNFTLTMLKNGTLAKNKEQIAEALDNIGGSISCQINNDLANISGLAFKEKSGELLDIMSEIVCSPSFPENELAKTKKEIIAQIQQQNENPFLYAVRLNRQKNYPDHYYGRNKLGTEKDIETITSADCKEFLNTVLNSSRQSLIIINGEVKYRKIADKINYLTAQIRTDDIGTDLRLPEKPSGNFIYKANHSTDIVLCNFLLPAVNQHQYALGNLAGDYLGGGLSSPIFQKMRENNGIGYAVGCFYDFQKYDSLLVIYIQTLLKDHKQNNTLIEEALSNIEIDKKALNKAKRHLLTKYTADQEALSSRGFILGFNEVMGLGKNYNYPRSIQAVSAKQLNDFIKGLKHINSFILQ